MKKTLLISLSICTSVLLAQEKNVDFQKHYEQIIDLKNKLSNQQSLVNQQKLDIDALLKKTISQEKSIDSLKNGIRKIEQNVQVISEEFGTKIQQTEAKTKDSISKLDNDVSTNRLYWIIATLAIMLLGGLTYWLLGRRISKSKTDVETQIKNTKKSLEEESIKLDSKLVEVLESQLKLKQEEKQAVQTSSSSEIDHSLALKVADEIVRIHKNLNQMDPNTKGLKQLSASVKRIQDNFASNGYELVEMLGKEYSEGMKVIANFVPDEHLETGKQTITRIIKPQVNFNGQMIQSAQIEVSVGE